MKQFLSFFLQLPKAALWLAAVSPVGLAACGDAQSFEETGSTEQHVIFGGDSRVDLFAAADRNLAALGRRSSVAMLPRTSVDQSNPNDVQVTGTRMSDRLFDAYFLSIPIKKPLCAKERFIDEISAAKCSGTLIGEDLVLLAGHCLDDTYKCADVQFVFGFYHDSATTMHPITSEDVYNCQAEVARAHDPSGSGLDYSVVRLDRNAGKRYTTPRVDTTQQAISSNARLGTVGVPKGIPLKVADGASVSDPKSPSIGYWTSNLDTSKGNSGGGVYDTSTDYTLKGIFARLDGLEFVPGDNDCVRWRGCSENGDGCYLSENVYASRAIADLCSKEPSNALCGPQDRVAFNTSDTHYAEQNTRSQWIYLPAGKQLTVSSCTGAGTSTGDTYFRLLNNEGVEVSYDDDTCGYYGGSVLQFTATTAGLYEFKAGCYADGSCSGTAQWMVQDPSVYLEAECPSTSVGGYAAIQTSDVGYSYVGHLTSAGSTAATSYNSTSADRATFSFNVPKAGDYKLFFRVDTDGDIYRDSWFHRVDSGAWVTINGTGTGDNWSWVQRPNTVTLTAGTHTIEVANRECYLSMDKLALVPAAVVAPPGIGFSATNCQ